MKSIGPGNISGFLDFSSRLLMPWAGIHVVREAIRDSKDAELLLELASRRDMFVGTNEEADWKGVLGLLPRQIAVVLEEAVMSPAFGNIDIKMLEDIVGCTEEGDWSEETLQVLPCGNNNKVSLKSLTNSQGFYLVVEYAGQGADIGTFVYIKKNFLAILTVIDFTIRARARHGDDLVHRSFNDAFRPWTGVGWDKFLYQGMKSLSDTTTTTSFPSKRGGPESSDNALHLWLFTRAL